MSDPSLEPEIAAFDAIHDELRDKFGPDEWVVISSGTLQAHFKKFGDAAYYVAENFGGTPVLVRQIDSAPVHVPYVLMRA